MFNRKRVFTLFAAIVAGGLISIGTATPAAAQFGPGFGYGPGFGQPGNFGSINLNLGFGRTPGFGVGCPHGCRKACHHLPPPPPPICPPAFGGYPGYGYGGGSYYREFRTGYGFPGYGGYPGFGGYPGRGW